MSKAKLKKEVSERMKIRITVLAALTGLLFLISVQSSSSQDISTPTKGGKGSPQFRAISGVSMGGYGAMNTGLSHPDFFRTMACLGGPLDMASLLKFIEVNILGNYDSPNLYPDRNTALNMLKDLAISFGNPVYYNPLSTYYPPGITSENARIPITLFNFFDGASNPDGSLPVITYTDPGPNDWVEVLLAVDLNGNGKRDPKEPIATRFHEPFTDLNANGRYDPGEPFLDVGLNGAPGRGGYGEGDGTFSFNPNHLNYFAQDPLTHLKEMDLSMLQSLNLYLDAGNEDEFEFNIHTDNFVKALEDQGLKVRIEDDFPVSFPEVSHFVDQKRVYVKYNGDHVGFNKENIGLHFKKPGRGVQGTLLVASRFATLFAFVSDHFPDGEYGTDPHELFRYPSKMGITSFYSPSLDRMMKLGIYLPPGYKGSKTTYYPVLYLLGGYNMSISGLANRWVQAALDALILRKEIQKMIIVIPDGINSKNGGGHFFVNQIDKDRGDNYMDYVFDLIEYVDIYFQTK